MFLDELPIWGFIGRAQKVAGGVAYYLFTHIHFEVLYNGDRVIEVNVATDPHRTVDITEDKPITVDFTYSVKWKETNVTFERRMEKYQRYAVNKHHLEVRYMQQRAQTSTHTDPLVFHRQLVRHGVAPHWLFGHHPHACAQARLYQVHP